MNWVIEPEAGPATMCNNCFFYAHGGCTSKCSLQECTIRF